MKIQFANQRPVKYQWNIEKTRKHEIKMQRNFYITKSQN